jgi:hypothetical protein
MSPSFPKYLTVALSALALAACQQPSGNPPTSAAGYSTAGKGSSTAPVIAAPPASAGTTSLPGDHATTAQYKIAISIPSLPATAKPLADALRATADDAKRQFLQALPDPDEHSSSPHRQLELHLEFTVAARTAAFTSVREIGNVDTGGAHPAPVEGSFVFDHGANRVITLADLFTQPDGARKALADFAHATLAKRLLANAPAPSDASRAANREWKTNMQQMLDYGTQPTSVNFALFVVRAGASNAAASPGLTLVFPPYQVAPYSAGTQTVDVPASVFAAFLKPIYRSDFAAR